MSDAQVTTPPPAHSTLTFRGVFAMLLMGIAVVGPQFHILALLSPERARLWLPAGAVFFTVLFSLLRYPRAAQMGLIYLLYTLSRFYLLPRYPVLFAWPWYLLIPLLGYLLLTMPLARVRRTMSWLRWGRFNRPVIIAILTISVVTTVALIVWYSLTRPFLGHVTATIPRWPLPALLMAGLAFAVGNAVMEEVMYRGIIQEALHEVFPSTLSSRLPLTALVVAVQGLMFGIAHIRGFPSGTVGIIMASAYGIMLGSLRWYARGMLAPIVAHIFADLTIFAVLLTLL